MKYHEDAYKRQLEASRGLKKKGEEKKTDEEKAAEFEDEFDEDY
jgi:26S proteasome regulatory subunit N3